MTPMPIINREKAANRPLCRFVIRRLGNVHYYRDAVFIVVSDESLVRICCIGTHYSIPFERALCLLMVRNDYALARLDLELGRAIGKTRIFHHRIDILYGQ